MKMDPGGDLVIAGDLTETNRTTRYLLLKYTPSGNLLWQRDYISEYVPTNLVRGFAIDKAGNIAVTGTSDTVYYRSEGTFSWMYGEMGADVAFDPEGNACVTGGSETRFRTIKITPLGTNAWTRVDQDYPEYSFFDSYSTRVAISERGDIFVGGFEVFDALIRPYGYITEWRAVVLKYGPGGDRLWKCSYRADNGWLAAFPNVVIFGLFPWPDGGVVVTGDYWGHGGAEAPDCVVRIGNDGAVAMTPTFVPALNTPATAFDSALNLYATYGINSSYWVYSDGTPQARRGPFGAFRTARMNPDGSLLWRAEWVDDTMERMGRNPRAIAMCGTNTVVITGEAPRPESGPDIITIAYDTETGSERWVRRYNGPANKVDAGYAVVADAAGNIYVAGTSENEVGGVDIVLLKYAAGAGIERGDTGVQLRFPGPVGGPVGIETSDDLASWTLLGTAVADPDGLARFTDTNVVTSAPARFYRSKP